MTHSIIDQPEFSVASSSVSTIAPEIKHVELIDDKPEHSSEIIEWVNNEPEISPDLSRFD
ncbi:22608_t:CDS:2 [Gigaspora margarita]|uniref:22608_t:CDS:1 n=1 Tax=Gigaspora margarita TaxID=4874 RepID=A0ABN7UBZ2_GIGMA|nr:22608_t:CDS:2 [Gigaspora margarita]